MRKYIFIVLFSLAFSLGLLSCGMHGLFADDLSDSKIAEALQEALFLGSKTAALNLGTSCSSGSEECKTGYLGRVVEIDLPDTIGGVLSTIDSFMDEFDALPSSITSTINSVMSLNSSLLKSSAASDFSDLRNNLRGLGGRIKDTLNRGAERAAPKSVDLFRDAIFDMSFSDARGILFGNDSTAATSYLKKTTFLGLQGIFGGILKNCLEELELNSFWKPYIASPYNSFASAYSQAAKSSDVKYALSLYNSLNSKQVELPSLPYPKLGEDLSGDLSKYATGKALEGLFYMVGVQEANLRADPWGTVKAVGGFITDAIGDLLGDVFSKAKEG